MRHDDRNRDRETTRGATTATAPTKPCTVRHDASDRNTKCGEVVDEHEEDDRDRDTMRTMAVTVLRAWDLVGL